MQHLSTCRQFPRFGLSVGTSGTTTTIEPAGEIDLVVAPQLAAACDTAIAAAPETVVLDLSGVEFIDSSGLHAIMGAERHAAARSVRLVVIPGGAAVRRAFAVSGLWNMLSVPVRAA